MTKHDESKPVSQRQHSKEFLRQAREHAGRTDTGDAFLLDPKGGPALAPDDFAEEIAESFLQSATSGEEAGEEIANADVPEEKGGPFVVTSAGREFADGTDLSNPEDAEPAPFPSANRSL